MKLVIKPRRYGTLWTVTRERLWLALVPLPPGFATGEIVYHFSGINGDTARVSDHLNAEVASANNDATTAHDELTTLQAADHVYGANHEPVPTAQKTMEQFETARITTDKTTATTLSKEIPSVPLSEATADFGGIGLGIVAVFSVAAWRARRAHHHAAAAPAESAEA